MIISKIIQLLVGKTDKKVTIRTMPAVKLIDNNKGMTFSTIYEKKNQNIEKQKKFKELYHQMTDIVKTRQLFLDPNLKQSDIVKYLGTNRNYLHTTLKLYTNDNFKAFINKHRITYAKKNIINRIRCGEDVILSDIFSECGFSTNESFYRIFKKITNQTPGEFMKQTYKDIHLTKLKEQY